MPRNYLKCAVQSCCSLKSLKDSPGDTSAHTFFRFPESDDIASEVLRTPETDRREFWVSFCGREPEWKPKVNDAVCHHHFNPDHFATQTMPFRLPEHAVPTLKRPTEPAKPILYGGKAAPAGNVTSVTIKQLSDSLGKLSTETVLEEFSRIILGRKAKSFVLPPSWTTIDFPAGQFYMYAGFDLSSGELLKSVGFSEELQPKIRIKSVVYDDRSYIPAKVTSIQDVSDMIWKLAELTICSGIVTPGSSTYVGRSPKCRLVYPSAKVRCEECDKPREALRASARRAASLDSTESRKSRSVSKHKRFNEKRYLEEKVDRQDKKIADLGSLVERLSRVLAADGKPDVSETLLDEFGRISELNKHDPDKYTDQFREFAVRLHYYSPKAYCYLRSNGLPLPHPNSIRNYIGKISTQCGFDKVIIAALSEIVVESDRDFLILADEMAISKKSYRYSQHQDKVIGMVDFGEQNAFLTPAQLDKQADHALVVSIRSLKTKCFQPFGLFFSNAQCPGDVLKRIFELAAVLFQTTRIIIRGFTTDAGTGNIRAFTLLGVDWETGIGIIVINGVSYYVIPDLVHLIKCLRNSLFYHDKETKQLMPRLMKFVDEDGNIIKNEDGSDAYVSFMHIVELHKLSQSPAFQGLRLHPKLTYTHVAPDSFNVQRVAPAVQILSKTTADALRIASVHVPALRNSGATIELADFADGWFDHGNSKVGNKKDSRKPASEENGVLDLLTKDLRRYRLWKQNVPKDERVNDDTLNRIIVNLTSSIALTKDLLKDGFKYVQLRNFNNDPQERFFAAIREGGRRSDNPTVENFLYQWRINTLHSLSKLVGVQCNVEVEEDFLMMKTATAVKLVREVHNRLEEADKLMQNAAQADTPLSPEELEDLEAEQEIAAYEEAKLEIAAYESADMVIDPISRKVIYYLSGFTCLRQGLLKKLCEEHWEILYNLNRPETDCDPEYVQFAAMRQKGGLQFVGSGLYAMFLALEKLFRKSVDSVFYKHPRQALLELAESNGCYDMFLAHDVFSASCNRGCLSLDLFRGLAGHFFRTRLHFKTNGKNDVSRKRGTKDADFKKNKLKKLTA